jgi:DNA-binding LytR/AlgR family response regulator
LTTKEQINKRTIKTLFYKPYPFTGNIRSYLLSNFFIGSFVALFLIIFQPFGTGLWETPDKNLKLAGFGMVSFVVPALINFVTLFFVSGKAREDKWTVGKEILSVVFVISCIAMGNLLYGRMLGVMPLSVQAYFGALLTTCLIGVFPVSAHVLMKQRRLQKINEENAARINDELLALRVQELLHESLAKTEKNIRTEQEDVNTENVPSAYPESEKQATALSLIAENGKDKLTLAPDQLLYIASADNYATIHYLENNGKKKMMLRSSLKRMEEQISNKRIVRCHRTWIVNLDHVKKVEGNAAGYRLILEHSEEMIPVSRNYATGLLEKLKV